VRNEILKKCKWKGKGTLPVGEGHATTSLFLLAFDYYPGRDARERENSATFGRRFEI